MRLFVFRRVASVSSHYHPEGGLVVVAEDIEHVRLLCAAHGSINLAYDMFTSAYDAEHPEREAEPIVYELAGDPEPTVFTFIDTGCCD